MPGYGFSYSTYDVGGYGIPIPAPVPMRANPRKEYVVTGPGRLAPTIPYALPAGTDDLTREFGFHTILGMLTDPAVSSSYLALKLGIIAGGMHLLPTHEPDATRKAQLAIARRKQPTSLTPAGVTDRTTMPDTETETDVALSVDEANAQAAVEYCERLAKRLLDWEVRLLNLMDAMAFGVKLAEVTCKVGDDGPDAGKLVWDTVKVKPWWSWRFVVDAWLNVKGILTFLPSGLPGISKADNGYLVLSPDKFVIASWLPVDNDPRGTILLRPAYAAWNLKIQILPQYYQHLVRWGSPGIDLEMAEGDTSPRIPTDDQGEPLPGAVPIPAETYALRNLIAYANGAALVHAAGSKVGTIEPRSNGEAFQLAFQWLDRQIVLAINLSARSSLEAEHGSKADTASGQDNRDLVTGFGRKWLGTIVRCMFKVNLALNFGKAFAEEYTPEVQFGEGQAQNHAELWPAVASLHGSGYLGESQQAELDAKAGLPPRDRAADDKAAKEKMPTMAVKAPVDQAEEKP